MNNSVSGTGTGDSASGTGTGSRRATAFGPLQIGICVLSGITALVHLVIGVITTAMVAGGGSQVEDNGGAVVLGIMAGLFYLSFLGYVVLPAVLYRRGPARRQRLARLGLIIWAAGNVLAYAVLAVGHYDAFGLADKVVELLLIGLLVVEGRRARQL